MAQYTTQREELIAEGLYSTDFVFTLWCPITSWKGSGSNVYRKLRVQSLLELEMLIHCYIYLLVCYAC